MHTYIHNHMKLHIFIYLNIQIVSIKFLRMSMSGLWTFLDFRSLLTCTRTDSGSSFGVHVLHRRSRQGTVQGTK